MRREAIFRSSAAIATLMASCLLTACSFLPSEPYREVKTFDLGVPAPSDPKANVLVQPFSADSACKFKMLYRAEGNEMLIDEYNRWTQPPGQMLTKYLRLAFRDAPGGAGLKPAAPKYELSGSILAFEADIEGKKVNIGVHYLLEARGQSELRLERTAIFSAPLKDGSPSVVAFAMSKAAEEFVRSVDSDIQALELAQTEAK